jgi:small GTP-binding protein
MTTLTSKICIVGDFAVGKTSVCERYVNNQFSDKYLTTVGVKVDTKELDLDDRGVSVKLVLWDVAGTDRFGDKEFAYLRGAAGFIFVADGTRSLTLGTARRLRKDIVQRYGERPRVLLVNKRDLTDSWEVSDALIEELKIHFGSVFLTSAKTGDRVEDALTHLAELVVDEIVTR